MGKDLKGKELGKGLFQRNNGRYIGRFVNRNGKRVEYSDTDLRKVKKWLRDSIYEDEHGLGCVNSLMTVSEWFNIWIENYKKDVVAYATYKNYVNSFKNHIEPRIGNMTISKVKSIDCQNILNEMDGNVLSFGTCNLCRITMHSLFDSALENNMILSNPITKSVKCKQREVNERRVLTKEEQNTFLKYSEGTIYENMYILCLQTGLRIGEISGLIWQDIDFANKQLKVQRTLQFRKKLGMVFGKPKTRNSYRVIPLTDSAINALEKQKNKLKELQLKAVNWTDENESFKDLIFKTNTGRPVAPSNVSSAIVRIVSRINMDRRIQEQLGECKFEEFQPIYMHCLRHTFATRCIENGVKPKALQKMLGHSCISTTMDLYVHVTDEELEAEAKKIDLLAI